MIEVKDLFGKSDLELKGILKNVIFDENAEIDWNKIFFKYQSLLTFDDRSEIFYEIYDKCHEVEYKYEDIDYDEDYYGKDFINEVDELYEECDRNIVKFLNKNKISAIKIENNSLNFYINRYILKIMDKDQINTMLDYIFKMIKEVIKAESKSNLNEITDFFSDLSEESSQKNNII